MSAHDSLDLTNPRAGDDPAAPPPGTDGLAVASFITGLLGFLVITLPLGLILGIAAMARTRRTGRKGRGLAGVGLVLTVLWTAGLTVALVIGLGTLRGPARDADGGISTPARAYPEDLRVGDCVAEITEGEVSKVEAVPCDRAGSSKVFAIFDLPDGDWPGDAKADELAGDGCLDRYEAPKGQDDDVEVTYIRPTADSWRWDDRRVLCLAPPSA